MSNELYELVRQKLNEMKAYGMPLPEDLVQFERDLGPSSWPKARIAGDEHVSTS